MHAQERISVAKRWMLSANWQGDLLWDVPMGRYCTFRAGGIADAMVDASSLGELGRLLRFLRQNEIAWRVIGRGSNILVSSEGFHGVIIRLTDNFNQVHRAAESTDRGSSPVIVHAGAGCSLARCIVWTTNQALSGLEFLSGIPGSVGGAIRMNAGAFGSEIGTCLYSISIIDKNGFLHELKQKDLQLNYRSTRYNNVDLEEGIIVAARFSLKRGIRREIAEKSRKYLQKRKAKQPGGVASAGSFFKNPKGDAAGRLIDAAGLKGLRRGNAMISKKHANFLVNTGGATASEIMELMQEVQKRVFNKFGIMLEPEVHLL